MGILDLLPPPLRKLFFTLTLQDFGKKSFIDYDFYYRYGDKIHIGQNVTINRGCQIFPSYKIRSAQIIIKDNSVLSPGVKLFGAGHDIHSLALPDKAGQIVISENCFIGANSIIRYGVTIGQGSVIGAGAVVVSDVEPWSVYAGNPAKKIKNRKILD